MNKQAQKENFPSMETEGVTKPKMPKSVKQNHLFYFDNNHDDSDDVDNEAYPVFWYAPECWTLALTHLLLSTSSL